MATFCSYTEGGANRIDLEFSIKRKPLMYFTNTKEKLIVLAMFPMDPKSSCQT